jgi:hypothetical protein
VDPESMDVDIDPFASSVCVAVTWADLLCRTSDIKQCRASKRSHPEDSDGSVAFAHAKIREIP